MSDTKDRDFDFKRLLLKSPGEEFADFATLRLRTAERLGDAEYELVLEAVELGKRLLKGGGDDSR